MTFHISTSKERHEIKSPFEVDVEAIAEMGVEGGEAASVASDINDAASGGLFGDDKIKKAVADEAWKIYYSGEGLENRQKRIDRVKELASVMGHKIMNKLYEINLEPGDLYFDLTNEEGGGAALEMGESDLDSNNIQFEEQDGETDAFLQDSYGIEDDAYGQKLPQLTDIINQNKDKIREIINSKVGRYQLSTFIIKYSDSISSEIASINQIYRSFKTGLSFGDMKLVVNDMLKSRSTEIATHLTSGTSDQVVRRIFNTISRYIKQKGESDIIEKKRFKMRLKPQWSEWYPKQLLRKNLNLYPKRLLEWMK